MARPDSLTPRIQKRICDAVKGGNYLQAAAAYAGISYACLRNWYLRGQRAKRGKFFKFFAAIRKAQAEAEATIVSQWREQIPANWPAARDFLARRYPERWGP